MITPYEASEETQSTIVIDSKTENGAQTLNSIKIERPTIDNQATPISTPVVERKEPKYSQAYAQPLKQAALSSALMEAFIKAVTTTLNNSSGSRLTADESGEIVIKCKSYLSSLIGNHIARRFIATTMLIVRNNYAELDSAKRASLVEYLESYSSVEKSPESIQDELLKLYKSGLKPL